MPGKVKTVKVESGFLAYSASRIVQLTRRESFFSQLSFSSPLFVIQCPFPTPPLYLLQFLLYTFPPLLGIANVRQGMILHFLSTPSFGSDYVLCQPSNLSGVQRGIPRNGSISVTSHNPLSNSNHDVIRQRSQRFNEAVIPSLYHVRWKIRLRCVLVYCGQETLPYLSRRKPIYSPLGVFNIQLMLQAAAAFGVS